MWVFSDMWAIDDFSFKHMICGRCDSIGITKFRHDFCKSVLDNHFLPTMYQRVFWKLHSKSNWFINLEKHYTFKKNWMGIMFLYLHDLNLVAERMFLYDIVVCDFFPLHRASLLNALAFFSRRYCSSTLF